MKQKKITVILLLLTLSSFIPGCKKDTPSTDGLNYKSALFVAQDSTGQYFTIDYNNFKRGDTINLVLYHVGKFQKGSDGQHHYDMNIEIRGPEGQMIFSQENLYGEKGIGLLPDGILELPCGTYLTTPDFRPGAYEMKLTIYDKVSGETASGNRQFILE